MKIFFMKAKFIQGDIDAEDCQFDDIRWCTKTQVKELVDPKYYFAIQNML